MSDYFPAEIIEKILLKLPVEPLIRFTAVCKSWRSIITSPSFISSHLYKTKTDAILVKWYSRKQGEYLSLHEVAQKKPITIISTKNFEIPLKWKAVDLRLVGSCRGVVCLSHHCSTRSQNSIILWNPRVRRHVVLPLAEKTSVLGFGFADHDFKVIGLGYLLEAHVFSLKTWTWRTLGIDGARLQNFRCPLSPVFLNGFVYWLVCYHNFDSTVLSFCLAQEMFHEIKLPNELATSTHWSDLSISTIGESLAILKYPYSINGKSHEVWLMQEEEEESWTRLYSFEMVQGVREVVALRKCSGEALVHTKKNELVAFDFMNSEINNLGIQKTSDFLYIESYVESLELLGGQSDSAQEFIEGMEEDLT